MGSMTDRMTVPTTTAMMMMRIGSMSMVIAVDRVLDLLVEEAGGAREHLVELAGRLAHGHHVDEERREDAEPASTAARCPCPAVSPRRTAGKVRFHPAVSDQVLDDVHRAYDRDAAF